MMHLRFVHAADLHLDSPFTGIRSSAPEGVAHALYKATFEAYDNLIDLCIEEKVDALLVAGDVYDSADRSLRAQQAFIRGLRRLDAAGIRSFVCHGNHDPLNGWEAQLTYPSSCHRFGAEWEAAPMFVDDPSRAVVYGISYAQQVVNRNLVSELDIVESGPFAIGLLHANVGDKPGHAPYAPCSLEDLERTGIDYWALGHVHTREVMRKHSPAVVYPGNPQGRHVNEDGARGVYLVEVDGDDIRLDFTPVDTVRWVNLSVDATQFETDQGLRDELDRKIEAALDQAEGRGVVARVSLRGRTHLTLSLRRQGYVDELIEDANSDWAARSPFVWCERIEDLTASPIDREELLKGSDFLAEVLRTAEGAKHEPEGLAKLRERLADLYQHHRYRRYLDALGLTDDELLALLDRAEAMTVELLAGHRP